MWLVEKFSDSNATVTADHDGVTVTLGGSTYELSRQQAAELRDSLGEALTDKREFVHTVGQYREDGTYKVSRRGADSAGHSKVFQSFEHLVRLFGRLPQEFTAEAVGRTGLTGGRRHLLVHHFAEHPDFSCELVSRQPLTAQKRGEGDEV